MADSGQKRQKGPFYEKKSKIFSNIFGKMAVSGRQQGDSRQRNALSGLKRLAEKVLTYRDFQAISLDSVGSAPSGRKAGATLLTFVDRERVLSEE